MKKYVTISLFIFWAVTASVVAAGLISRDKNNQQALSSEPNGIEGSLINNISGIDPKITQLVLSKNELIKHNSASSCWLLVSGKIYDVTPYIKNHPGGAAEILNNCGTDATTAYDTKGGEGKQHSASANSMLTDYFIGNLNQTLNLSAKQTTTKTSTQNPNSKTTQNQTQTPIQTQTSQTANTQTTISLTLAELTKHNSASSCWTLVSNKIYDLTSYINRHPGGSGAVLSLCGADGTAAFVAQHGSSSAAQSALASLYVGDLNQTITTSTSSGSISPQITSPAFVPNSYEEYENEEEYEDD